MREPRERERGGTGWRGGKLGGEKEKEMFGFGARSWGRAGRRRGPGKEGLDGGVGGVKVRIREGGEEEDDDDDADDVDDDDDDVEIDEEEDDEGEKGESGRGAEEGRNSEADMHRGEHTTGGCTTTAGDSPFPPSPLPFPSSPSPFASPFPSSPPTTITGSFSLPPVIAAFT